MTDTSHPARERSLNPRLWARAAARVALSAGAITLAVSGCSLFESSDSPGGATTPGSEIKSAGSNKECLAVSTANGLDPAGSALAVILDVSFSTGDGPAREAAFRAAEGRVAAHIDGDPAKAAIVWAGTFDAASTTVNFDECLSGAMLVPRGNNAAQREQKVSKDMLAQSIAERFDVLGEVPPSKLGTDPVGAMAAGVERVKSAQIASDGSREVDIYTDGIATTGCLAIGPNPDFNDLESAKTLGKGCVGSGELPEGRGVTVRFLGVGRASTSASTEQAVWLKAALMSACEQTGADCDSTESLEP